MVLVASAALIGFTHTVLGPDHYLPFIVLGRARKWSFLKTTWITLLCGLGHIGSSVAIGLVGVALGVSMTKLEVLESFRSDLAAWILIVFGFVYLIWGLRRAIRNRPHGHWHAHREGEVHTHPHGHASEKVDNVHTGSHVHFHEGRATRKLTPWVLFTIFVFGPCEPLIFLLIYPASQMDFFHVALVIIVFGVVTLATMLAFVLLALFGWGALPLGRFERYDHALAGATLLFCGVAIRFLGL